MSEPRHVKLAPSLFAADQSDLRGALKLFIESGVDFIHFDIMDNHFVPNISFGPKTIEDVCQAGGLPGDMHLMIDLDVPDALGPYLKLPPEYVTLHLESTSRYIGEHLLAVKKSGKKAGLSIKPGTPVKALAPYLDIIDLVLIMSVEPGFSGQGFMDNSLGRITETRALLGGRDILLQVDGGVGRGNAASVASAGADFLVMGSAFYKDNDPSGLVRMVHDLKAGN